MRIILTTFSIILFCVSLSQAQIKAPSFGKGLQITSADTSFYMRIGARFQNLFTADWSLADAANGYESDFEANAIVRRSRLKFDGWAVNPKLKYKLELSLSNRDNGGGTNSKFGNAANIILDAIISYKFYDNLTIVFGQSKLAGNRERVISSGNLQFVDRSRLNSRFTLDRDVFVQLKYDHMVGDNFLVRENFAVSSGEGKNHLTGDNNGLGYTARVELLPFGSFQSKGDYVGSSVKRESTPKLALGFTYDKNVNALRERGQKGTFLTDRSDSFIAKDLESFFADLMFKYQGFSVMMEYVDRTTSDGISEIFDTEGSQIGKYYTGSSYNVAAGYMFDNNMEVALRMTDVAADSSTDEKHYTIGLNKFFVGHKLKIQMDYSYINRLDSQNTSLFRTQVDIHF